jgi:hypothetical protein
MVILILKYFTQGEVEMSLFGSKAEGKTVTDTEFSWKKNNIRIINGYLKSEGLINMVRIPIKHIETVTYVINTTKPSISVELRIIGKGTILGTLEVGIDLKDEIQDWLLEKLEL